MPFAYSSKFPVNHTSRERAPDLYSRGLKYMIVYKETKAQFVGDVLSNDIAGVIHRRVQQVTGGRVSESEVMSWGNSLLYMNNVLADEAIPDDARVSIEYHLPRSSKRVDFLLSGRDETGRENVVLIELKQWSEAEATEMDGIVRTRFRRGWASVSHPSYQAWSYAALLESFNATIQNEGIGIWPCAYCHNYDPNQGPEPALDHPAYDDHRERAPLFLKPDALRLRDFIKRYVKYGDDADVIYRIEHGEIRPSKSLADALESMLRGNEEFVMLDEQKVVYEKALALAERAGSDDKHVLIVEGGPGTGKSVVAVNLLVALTSGGHVAQYVTKNAAPRAVYEQRLVGSHKKSAISNLFTGSGAFQGASPGEFDVLIVDEAHRLNEKSGLYKNLGENQVMELVRAADLSVFFLDEDQRVTFDDIGERVEIERWAAEQGATVHSLELSSQFRCNGSDGYLAWLDHTLGIRETANPVLTPDEFDFRVVDSPAVLRDLIREKNDENKARMVAGYCWRWVSKKDPSQDDIVFPEYGFSHKWNLTTDGSLWIESPDSIGEVGCIHTCQGLELDYVGVIVGRDLQVRGDEVVTDASERASYDSSVRGYKKKLKEDPEAARELADRVIKNTYRTLLTRGMKGCYVYFVDDEAADFFRSRMASAAAMSGPDTATADSRYRIG
ncbi:DNA/RNA helicase domain-containing protein [Rubrivirga sp. IMCC45206]|uniref:DNA/RNA helicase domain-containing protein n=1 Tax=Rubrivirga sp. IMCC45206 TaxID=3391614 RepID=UPI00399009AB